MTIFHMHNQRPERAENLQKTKSSLKKNIVVRYYKAMVSVLSNKFISHSDKKNKVKK